MTLPLPDPAWLHKGVFIMPWVFAMGDNHHCYLLIDFAAINDQ